MNKTSLYIIRDGDSLHSIAQRVLGDTDRWVELALLNALNYPFIVPIGTPTASFTRTAGDPLVVPQNIGENDVPEALVFDSDALSYGVDLALTSDKASLSLGSGGEFIVNAFNDLDTVSGIDCLKQDLIHRLITERGTLPYHPDYGSEFLTVIGNKNDPNWRDKAVIELTKTFRSDPRVVDVKGVKVSIIDGGGLAIDCTVLTLDYRLPMILNF